jgi:acyl carrier protein
MADTIAQEIRSFVVANFLFGQDDGKLTDEASFLETGTIDSTGVLELVAFVEQKYGISIGDKELVPENLDSVANVSRFVARKLETRGVLAG